VTWSGRPMQPEDILGLRAAGDAQPSPDGQRIAYVVSELDRVSDHARSSIWLVDSNGGNPRLLTNVFEDASHPRWSPDSNALAFISSREGSPQIWLVSLNGAQPVRLTSLSGGVTGPPVWSSDGHRIAFTARVPSTSAPAAGAPRVIRRLRYMLNGSGYIGDGFWHVFMLPVDDAGPGSAVQLTSGEWHHFSPAWSPDSRHVTCISTRRDDWDTEWVWDVYVLDADDCHTAPLRLTESRGTCAAPAWSPDGRWIAYFDNRCPGTAYTKDYDLWLVPASGGAARKLSGALQRGCQISQPPSVNEPPYWSPDSTTIFFHVRDAGFLHYYAYDVANDRLRPVLASRDVDQPIMALVRQSLDGKVLALAAPTSVRPAELYTATPGGGDCHQLTNLNRTALASFHVRAPRRLTRTSPEGWEVESWLWLPPSHETDDAPLPTVLYFHGGPHNTVALGFNDHLHALAGAGFAVVAVNFRGSTGFGAAFADCILGDWGPRELADGLAVVDALVGEGIADPRRLGVCGGSYGGFMTNLALARTDRFAAGVSFATISGLHSWSYVTDHWESVDWDSGGTPWQIPEYYETHSPLTYVANIEAPLLILHGEEDYRCSVTEADQLFGALRKLKRTVELVRYPGGSHAFAHVGPPSHRLDALQRMVAWFQRHL
jgi:dipeptidyl aminopeptidase/acylaminoacyl peptidase